MYVAIDFDGTIVEHEYPNIGKDIPQAIETLKELEINGHKLILNTMRSGDKLQEAVEYLSNKGVTLFGVNKNPTQHHWTTSPKIYSNIYIDDASLGTPLIYPPEKRPYVDWSKIRVLLKIKGLI